MSWNYQLFIDGRWTDGGANCPIKVIDPATEEAIGEVPDTSVEDAGQAIAAARRAFDDGPWPYLKPRERGVILRRMADALKSRHDVLREMIVAETGATGPMLMPFSAAVPSTSGTSTPSARKTLSIGWKPRHRPAVPPA